MDLRSNPRRDDATFRAEYVEQLKYQCKIDGFSEKRMTKEFVENFIQDNLKEFTLLEGDIAQVSPDYKRSTEERIKSIKAGVQNELVEKLKRALQRESVLDTRHTKDKIRSVRKKGASIDQSDRRKANSIMDHIQMEREGGFLQRLERGGDAQSSLKLDLKELSMDGKRIPKQTSQVSLISNTSINPTQDFKVKLIN